MTFLHCWNSFVILFWSVNELVKYIIDFQNIEPSLHIQYEPKLIGVNKLSFFIFFIFNILLKIIAYMFMVNVVFHMLFLKYFVWV